MLLLRRIKMYKCIQWIWDLQVMKITRMNTTLDDKLCCRIFVVYLQNKCFRIRINKHLICFTMFIYNLSELFK